MSQPEASRVAVRVSGMAPSARVLLSIAVDAPAPYDRVMVELSAEDASSIAERMNLAAQDVADGLSAPTRADTVPAPVSADSGRPRRPDGHTVRTPIGEYWTPMGLRSALGRLTGRKDPR